MSIRGILFDFNGTLYFDSRMHIDAFNEVFTGYGAPTHDDAYMVANIFGRDNGTIFRQNVDPDATPEEIEEFAQKKELCYQAMCKSSEGGDRLVKGADELLDFLKESGIPYCMATGSDWINVQFYFDCLGLGRWFSKENIVYCDKTYPGKPAPDIYKIAARRIGLDPSECLVFEDGTSGILSANGAGAAKVVLIHEDGYPSPLTEETVVDRMEDDFANWREILTEYGII